MNRLAALVVFASPALALDRGPPAQTLGPIKAPSATVSGPITAGTVATPTAIIGTLRMVNDTPAATLDLHTVPPPNYLAMTGDGARVNLLSLQGDPGNDRFRAMLAVRATSQVGATALESAANIEMRGLTGYARPWVTGITFATGTQIKGPNGHHYAAASACTSGTGPGPTVTSGNQSDGGCTWGYIGDGTTDNKTGLTMTVTAEGPQNGLAGGGQAWGAAIIFGAKPGAWPNGGGFGATIEADTGNENRDCPPYDPTGCKLYGLFVNAEGTFPSTIGLFLGGHAGYHIGALISNAIDVAYQESTTAGAGFLVDQYARHSIASFRDLSTSRTASSYEGTYSSSSVLNTGISPIGFYGHAANSNAGFYEDMAANGFRAAGSRPAGSDFLSEGAADYGFRVVNAKGQAAFASPGFYVGPTGTVNAPGYVVGNSIGATCTSAPTASFRVVGGIVVTC